MTAPTLPTTALYALGFGGFVTMGLAAETAFRHTPGWLGTTAIVGALLVGALPCTWIALRELGTRRPTTTDAPCTGCGNGILPDLTQSEG